MLSIDAINAYYGDSHIVQSVSFAIADGASVALLGRNGAGKTTILKAIMGSGPRTEGGITLDDTNLVALPTHQRARLGMGLVPEDRRIYSHISVAENIEMARYAVRKGMMPYSVGEVFDMFPLLKGLEQRKGSALSGGQQQMLAVARTVLAKPRYLLLDEPTEGLAPVIVESLAHQLNAIRKREGMALILTEQNVWFARQCTDRLLLVDSGQIVFTGDWAAFDAAPEIQNRYLAV